MVSAEQWLLVRAVASTQKLPTELEQLKDAERKLEAERERRKAAEKLLQAATAGHSQDIERQVCAAKEQHSLLQQQHLTLQHQYSELQDQLRQERAAFKRQHSTLKQHYSALEEKHSALEEKHSVLQEQRSALQWQHSALAEKHSALEEKLSVLQEQRSALQWQHSALEEKHSALEEKHSALQEQRSALQWQHSALAEKHSALEEKLSVLQEQRSALQWQHSALEEKHSALEEYRSALEDRFRMISNEFAESKAQVEIQWRQTAENLCATRLRRIHELQGQLQLQKNISSFGVGAHWQYEIDNHWEAFSPEANAKMLEAYLEYLKDVTGCRYTTINSGGVDRTVDFEVMKQENLRTQTMRCIRLSTGAPAQWITPAADLLQQGNHAFSFYKEVTDHDILQSILRILRTTGHALDPTSPCSCMNKAEIKSVHRIENMRLWHRYKARLAAMRQDHVAADVVVGYTDLDLDGVLPIMADSQKILDCGQELALDLDEKILLHGTSWDNASKIAQEGFDHRTGHGGLYGDGVYFACAACKSNQYTCNLHKRPGSMPFCTCERTLIIARVALGDAYVAKEARNDRRPPMRAGSGTYDSIVVKPGFISGHHNSQQIHQEFVIFDREQAYPCYVVQYRVWAWPVGNWASKIFNLGIELEKTEAVDLRVQKRFGAASAAADSSV